MIELNCKTTTNYNKVWGWLKTQVIIGLSTNSSYMLSLFYSQKMEIFYLHNVDFHIHIATLQRKIL